MTIITIPISEKEIAIPRSLIGKLNPTNSVFLSLLLTKESQLRTTKSLDQCGYFTITENEIFEQSTISSYLQSKAIKILTKLKILYPVKRKGIPAKRHFKINHEELKALMDNPEIS